VSPIARHRQSKPRGLDTSPDGWRPVVAFTPGAVPTEHYFSISSTMNLIPVNDVVGGLVRASSPSCHLTPFLMVSLALHGFSPRADV
jgi:hypothetical protein